MEERTCLAALLPATTASPQQTRALGARLAEHFGPGDVVALYGDLGAGKTQLVKGLCAALGVDEQHVTSPTFTLLHEYDGRTCGGGPSGGAPLPVYHFGAYRLDGPDAFYALGYEEYFYSGGLCLIEWPARIEPLLPAEAIRLRLTHQGSDRRLIEWMNRREEERKKER